MLEYLKKNTLIATFLVIIILDQMLKVTLDIDKNYGLVLGILKGNLGICIFLTLFILIILIILLKNNKKKIRKIGFILIISGLISNLIDRLILGYVRDYIPFLNITSFNLADSAAIIGIIVLILNRNRIKWK